MREEVKGPPPGFRKAIPVSVRLDVVIRQEGRCKTCNEKLGQLANTEFDHVPALQLRTWDEEAGDTIPPANAPENIEAKHTDCHARKTRGNKATTRGSDVQEIARIKRLSKAEKEFRQKLLSKGEDDEDAPPQRRTRWPKRPLRSGGFGGKKSSRHQKHRPEGDAE